MYVCMYVCMYVRLSKHFGLWSPNGWADRDGRILVRCAGAAGKQWCRLQTDRSHVAGATSCNLAKSYKNFVRGAAGQTNGRILPKLGEPIATMGGCDALGCRRWRPLHTCERHVKRDFTLLYFAPERLVRFGRERHHSNRTDDGKTMARFPVQFRKGREFESLDMSLEINLRF